jgi:hypothetical protein
MSNVVKLDAFMIDYVKVQRYISNHLAVYLTQAIPISKVQRYIKAHHVSSSVPIQQRKKITDNDKAA